MPYYSPRQLEIIRARSRAAHQERAARQLVGETVVDEEFSEIGEDDDDDEDDLLEIEGVRPPNSPPPSPAPASTARTYQPAISGQKVIDPANNKTIATINYGGAAESPILRFPNSEGKRHIEMRLTNDRINLLIETLEQLRPLVIQTDTYRLEDETVSLQRKIEKAQADIVKAKADLERAQKARADMLDQVGLFVPARDA